MSEPHTTYIFEGDWLEYTALERMLIANGYQLRWEGDGTVHVRSVFYPRPCAACGGRMAKGNITAIYTSEGMIHKQCAEKFAELGFGPYPRVDDEPG